MLYDSIYDLIPYCQRLDGKEEEEELSMISYENVLNKIKFSELYQKGVTSMDLLNWGSSIDVAERYEKNGENSNEIFNNYDTLLEFNNIGQFIFTLIDILPGDQDLITGPCYPLLIDCYRGPLSICLDWKEICDGFSDCLAGTDELHSKRNNRDLMDYQYEELIGRRSFSYLCSTIQYFLILGNTDILNLYCRQLLNYFIENYFGYYIIQKTSNNLTYEYLINNCPSE
ncbi:unnamed protein product [Adineta steineri]|uniref:Uncharacterized protein n=1 Tax=Adineta steineri TaxID=433720 RepID=A0A819CHT8_9BILA|nr:unnamed protein product [Adineta steineri]CAF3820074.1 unnamed protein product [Adineta steineri]